eukprot:TRINITY_DN7751_c0_g1_i1.p1 TRINITY_DN7751_c0_g1~~TRINITY_DN7751_c0_g1_i1.p1  ORF type:complete len:93 (-),score=9.18 TRINITY_DN7751_c0_g1_i1:311-589(-)
MPPLQINVAINNKAKVLDVFQASKPESPFRSRYFSQTNVSVQAVFESLDLDSVEDVDLDLFDSLKDEVLQLMEEDSYMRYRYKREMEKDDIV